MFASGRRDQAGALSAERVHRGGARAVRAPGDHAANRLIVDTARLRSHQARRDDPGALRTCDTTSLIHGHDPSGSKPNRRNHSASSSGGPKCRLTPGNEIEMIWDIKFTTGGGGSLGSSTIGNPRRPFRKQWFHFHQRNHRS